MQQPGRIHSRKVSVSWQEQRVMCHFNLSWSQVPSSSLAVALKMTVQIPLQIQEKAGLTSVAKNSLYLQSFVLFTLSLCLLLADGWTQMIGSKGLSFLHLTWKLLNAKHLSKAYTRTCFNHYRPKQWIKVGTNNRLNKDLVEKSWGMRA